MWDVGCGMLDVGCGMWDVGCGMLDGGCWIFVGKGKQSNHDLAARKAGCRGC